MFGTVVRGRVRVWCLGNDDGLMVCGCVGGGVGSSGLVAAVGCSLTVADLRRLCKTRVGKDLVRRRIQRSCAKSVDGRLGLDWWVLRALHACVVLCCPCSYLKGGGDRAVCSINLWLWLVWLANYQEVNLKNTTRIADSVPTVISSP